MAREIWVVEHNDEPLCTCIAEAHANEIYTVLKKRAMHYVGTGYSVVRYVPAERHIPEEGE